MNYPAKSYGELDSAKLIKDNNNFVKALEMDLLSKQLGIF